MINGWMFCIFAIVVIILYLLIKNKIKDKVLSFLLSLLAGIILCGFGLIAAFIIFFRGSVK